MKDSDGDGLTDIVRDKIFTDKHTADSDGDSIAGCKDLNPRIHFPATAEYV